MSRFLVTASSAPSSNVALAGGALMKADRRTEFGPSIIGDPSVPTANTLTSWGQPLQQVIPLIDPGVPLLQYRNSLALGGLDPLAVWKSQPSVRKVVDFIARNVAAVPWKVYSRNADNDRERHADSPAEQALRKPARFLTGYKLWHDVVVDACLYDAWCVAYLLMPGDDTERLYRIPPKQLIIVPGNLGTIGRVGVRVNASLVLDITDQPLAIGTGWADGYANGVSPMTTLSAILAEQSEAVQWRRSKWAQTPKAAGLLTRPLEAPTWQPEQREAFLATWRTWRDGTAQGTPILEDGMGYDVLDGLNPADAKDIEGRALTDAEVSSAFHIAPELVGARQGTFSNVAAFRQMLYGPALGPRLSELEQAVNMPGGLVETLDDTPDIYAELDREAAMQGSFAEQASYLQTSIGAPWITPNEGRAKVNMPALEGGDELVKPLNVTQGGQASPTDSGAQNEDPNAPDVAPAPSDGKAFHGRLVTKATGPSSTERDALRDVLADVFRRMALDISGPVDADAFHQAWDTAVAKAVHPHLSAAAVASAQRVLKGLDAPDDAWSAAVMANYLDAMADTHASRAVAHVVEAASVPEATEDHAAFTVALAAGVGTLAVTALADAFGFGAHDAAHASGAATKTWDTGGRPRSSHAAMDGETVKADEAFSNGLMWPGDSRGDAAQTAHCNCEVTYAR